MSATAERQASAAPSAADDLFERLRQTSEYFAIPLLALVASALLFSLFLLALGRSPVEFFDLMWRGGFGSAFSWQNTLQRAAPLVLTALCVAIPARIGLVIIGGEGALVLGGLAAAVIAVPLLGVAPAPVLLAIMALAAMLMGALWIGLAGALRHSRGVNETISSLLLTYIAIAIMYFLVEGALRDPRSLNKPSTVPIGAENMLSTIPGTDIHWGLATGAVIAILLQVLMSRTTFGFAARITGGNPRAARAQGLPVGTLTIACTMIAGACAGLAGFFEVATVHGGANGSLVAGYGFTGILVSFLARHTPLAVIPVAVLFGGIAAAGGLVQRRMGLPDATVLLLQGFIFVVLLASETLYGRLPWFRPKGGGDRS